MRWWPGRRIKPNFFSASFHRTFRIGILKQCRNSLSIQKIKKPAAHQNQTSETLISKQSFTLLQYNFLDFRFEEFSRTTAYNNAQPKYGRKEGTSAADLWGSSVGTQVVPLINFIFNCNFRFLINITTRQTNYEYPYFGYADRCDAMVAGQKNKAELSSAAIRKVFELQFKISAHNQNQTSESLERTQSFNCQQYNFKL